jgi:glycosyltransferase involved in cell wall biosynthesis
LSRSPNVLLITESFPPHDNITARAIGETVRRLPAETVVTTPNQRGSGGTDRGARCTIRRARTFVGPTGFGLKLWKTQIGLEVARAAPDLIIAIGRGIAAEMARELAKTRGIPYVLRLDATEAIAIRTAIQSGSVNGQRQREALEGATAIFVSSGTAWLESYKLLTRPHDLEMWLPGVDTAAFSPGEPSAAVRKKLRLEDGPVLVARSEADPNVDPETIFRAFAAIRSEHRHATLIASGLGGAERHRAMLKQLRVDRGVRFVQSSDVSWPDVYRTADLFLTAHRSDKNAVPAPGLEIPVIEAMACGLPFAGTRTAAMMELTPEEEPGLLVEPGSHPKLGTAALALIGDEERRKELGEGARARALETFDAETIAGWLSEFFRILLVRRLQVAEFRPEPAEELRSAG